MVKPRLLSLLILGLLVLSSGCATKIYQGPTTGRSAEQQLAVSVAAEDVVQNLDLSHLANKAVYLQLYGLTPEGSAGESPEESYLGNLLVERFTEIGATLAADPKRADRVVTVAIRSAGVDVIRRDLPPLYHHTTYRGLVDVRCITYDQEKGVVTGIEKRQDGRRESTYREIYILYIIGPFRNTAVEQAEDVTP